jgi:hypothetical protein
MALINGGFNTRGLIKEAERHELSIYKKLTGDTGAASLTPEIFADEGRALNPAEQRKKLSWSKLIDKLNDDIRGIKYTIDIYEMMTLCVDYYNSLYEKRGDDDEIYERIALLAEKMNEYTYGVVYLDYIADTELRDTLQRSQLKTLYYKITANRKGM